MQLGCYLGKRIVMDEMNKEDVIVQYDPGIVIMEEYIVLLSFLISGLLKEITVTHSYLNATLPHNLEESGDHSSRRSIMVDYLSR